MSFNKLPEECIANVLSFTSPKDACRLSAVSPTFLSASESDVVWERFLPEEYKSIISNSNSPSLLETATSKKQVYLNLCDNPIIVENGRKSLSLEKRSGKICYMLSARDLMIKFGDNPRHWAWTSIHVFRFAEVAQLKHVCCLEICCKINTRILSPAALYTVHLVFKLQALEFGFYKQPVDVTLKLDGIRCGGPSFRWIVDKRPFGFDEIGGQYSNEIGDGWLEIKLGHFFSKGGEHEELEISIFDGSNYRKRGLIVAGIEFRPKGLISFSLEKRNGKICYMLSARELIITEGDNPENWTWTSNPVFRFPEVAQLIHGRWIEICLKINTSILSPSTPYNAYLAFQLSRYNCGMIGFYSHPVKVTMKLDGVCRCEQIFVWNEGEVPFGWNEIGGHYSNEITVGWLEIEFGHFFSKGSKHEELEIKVFDCAHYWKRGSTRCRNRVILHSTTDAIVVGNLCWCMF